MKFKSEQGFTLIEMMIVVAIIGILATVALPAYQRSVTRAQVSEALQLGSGLKAPLAEWASDKNAWPVLVAMDQSADAAKMNAMLTGKYSIVQSVIGGTFPAGTISVRMTIGRASDGLLTISTPNGGLNWVCGYAAMTGFSGGGTTINQRYLPNACRN